MLEAWLSAHSLVPAPALGLPLSGPRSYPVCRLCSNLFADLSGSGSPHLSDALMTSNGLVGLFCHNLTKFCAIGHVLCPFSHCVPQFTGDKRPRSRDLAGSPFCVGCLWCLSQREQDRRFDLGLDVSLSRYHYLLVGRCALAQVGCESTFHREQSKTETIVFITPALESGISRMFLAGCRHRLSPRSSIRIRQSVVPLGPCRTELWAPGLWELPWVEGPTLPPHGCGTVTLPRCSGPGLPSAVAVRPSQDEL